MRNVLLGCVADDFTGASDAASFLHKAGLRTVLWDGISENMGQMEDCQAVVVALKTRSIPAGQAVRETLAAVLALREVGAAQLYFKYCSTFDSTPQGNIGPVADAVLEELGQEYTLLCPSLVVNGRTVRDGRLYVQGVPLDESPMRSHPLNPMWDARIAALMEPQSKYPCLTVDSERLSQGRQAIELWVGEHRGGANHYYLVPDFETEEQGRQIAETFGDLPFLTGGSGLLEYLAARLHPAPAEGEGATRTGVEGAALLLAGSCSEATREQVRVYRNGGGATVPVDPALLAGNSLTVEQVWQSVQRAGSGALVHSTGAESGVAASGNTECRDREAALLETLFAQLGQLALQNGYKRLIIAGGETSGAVMQALSFRTFAICESVAPGVPVMAPKSGVRVVLKSGNFGQPDFFAQALRLTGGEK